jgi:hypothetical protein
MVKFNYGGTIYTMSKGTIEPVTKTSLILLEWYEQHKVSADTPDSELDFVETLDVEVIERYSEPQIEGVIYG